MKEELWHGLNTSHMFRHSSAGTSVPTEAPKSLLSKLTDWIKNAIVI